MITRYLKSDNMGINLQPANFNPLVSSKKNTIKNI